MPTWTACLGSASRVSRPAGCTSTGHGSRASVREVEEAKRLLQLRQTDRRRLRPRCARARLASNAPRAAHVGRSAAPHLWLLLIYSSRANEMSHDHSAHRAEVGGTTYGFCSAGCRAKFVADPQKYLNPDREASRAAPPAPPGTIYTCPMDPEIRQDHPGTCPKCGMALEPLMPSLEDEGE